MKAYKNFYCFNHKRCRRMARVEVDSTGSMGDRLEQAWAKGWEITPGGFNNLCPECVGLTDTFSADD